MPTVIKKNVAKNDRCYYRSWLRNFPQNISLHSTVLSEHFGILVSEVAKKVEKLQYP